MTIGALTRTIALLLGDPVRQEAGATCGGNNVGLAFLAVYTWKLIWLLQAD